MAGLVMKKMSFLGEFFWKKKGSCEDIPTFLRFSKEVVKIGFLRSRLENIGGETGSAFGM